MLRIRITERTVGYGLLLTFIKNARCAQIRDIFNFGSFKGPNKNRTIHKLIGPV